MHAVPRKAGIAHRFGWNPRAFIALTRRGKKQSRIADEIALDRPEVTFNAAVVLELALELFECKPDLAPGDLLIECHKLFASCLLRLRHLGEDRLDFGFDGGNFGLDLLAK